MNCSMWLLFLQAEDGIRDLVRSRGLGDVYKRQPIGLPLFFFCCFAWLNNGGAMVEINGDSP